MTVEAKPAIDYSIYYPPGQHGLPNNTEARQERIAGQWHVKEVDEREWHLVEKGIISFRDVLFYPIERDGKKGFRYIPVPQVDKEIITYRGKAA